jgi:hypothetical protein
MAKKHYGQSDDAGAFWVVPEAHILAAVSHCSVSSETCESNVRFGTNSLATSAVGRTGDLGSSKNLDFQAPWHHFQLVRLFG